MHISTFSYQRTQTAPPLISAWATQCIPITASKAPHPAPTDSTMFSERSLETFREFALKLCTRKLHSTVALSKNPRILPHLNSPKASLNLASTELYEESFHISSNIDRVPSKISLCLHLCVCLSQYLHLEKEMVDTAKLATQEFQHKKKKKTRIGWSSLRIAYLDQRCQRRP